jgi:hypothetical protein
LGRRGTIDQSIKILFGPMTILSNMAAISNIGSWVLEICLAWIEMCYKYKIRLDYKDLVQRKECKISC